MASPQSLDRVLGLWGAVWLGLGSILGTGVFVSLGIAAEVAGSAVVAPSVSPRWWLWRTGCPAPSSRPRIP